jgi:hypothetical protein
MILFDIKMVEQKRVCRVATQVSIKLMLVKGTKLGRIWRKGSAVIGVKRVDMMKGLRKSCSS